SNHLEAKSVFFSDGFARWTMPQAVLPRGIQPGLLFGEGLEFLLGFALNPSHSVLADDQVVWRMPIATRFGCRLGDVSEGDGFRLIPIGQDRRGVFPVVNCRQLD